MHFHLPSDLTFNDPIFLENLERVSLLRLSGMVTVRDDRLSDLEVITRLNPRKVTIDTLQYEQGEVKYTTVIQ